jgi:hypothetical protein
LRQVLLPLLPLSLQERFQLSSRNLASTSSGGVQSPPSSCPPTSGDACVSNSWYLLGAACILGGSRLDMWGVARYLPTVVASRVFIPP